MFAKGLRRARSATVGMWLAYALQNPVVHDALMAAQKGAGALRPMLEPDRERSAPGSIGVEDIEDAVLGTFRLLSDRPVVRTLAQIATKHANSVELAHMKVRVPSGAPTSLGSSKKDDRLDKQPCASSCACRSRPSRIATLRRAGHRIDHPRGVVTLLHG